MGALIGGGGLALTVHGPAGEIDLVVPSDARIGDVAQEYAEQTGTATPPRLVTRTGRRLSPTTTLSAGQIRSGALLVVDLAGAADATGATREEHAAPTHDRAPVAPGGASAMCVAIASAAAVLAGWAAAQAGGAARDVTAVLLGLAALIGIWPHGPLAPHRAAAAPAFAGAAAFALAWGPGLDRLPGVVGFAALAAAVAAAVARALDRRSDEALRVWIVVGAAVFVIVSGCALFDFGAQVPWALLFVAAVFAGRMVPSYAVDVPDHHLIDLERLAVSAWSARELPTGRRGRTIVPVAAVDDVATRGARTLTASSWAVLAVASLSGPMLLLTATRSVDRIGARIVVVAGALALLLAARSYRYAFPRTLLRAAGLIALVAGLTAVAGSIGTGWLMGACVASIAVGLGTVAAAVATGRGWRSVWWSARAELAEALTGATTIGTLVVAVGFFRFLWELRFGV